MAPFLPALFHLSHLWSELDLVAGGCDRAGQAPSCRVSDHAGISSCSAGGCQEAQPPVGSNSSSPGHVHVYSAAAGGKEAPAPGWQLCSLETTPGSRRLHECCSETELDGHFSNLWDMIHLSQSFPSSSYLQRARSKAAVILGAVEKQPYVV